MGFFCLSVLFGSFFFFLISNINIFLSFIFELEGIILLILDLTVTMFHDGQKNVFYLFLTVDGSFCSEALTSVMRNLNPSNSQRSRAIEVANTLFRQRK